MTKESSSLILAACSLLLLFSGIPSTEGRPGVGVVTEEIEAAALELWQKYCGESSDGGTDDVAGIIYCKRSKEKVEESLQHEAPLAPQSAQKDQVVFVQPPSYHYKHDVIVTGGGGQGPKTVIYVKPSKNTHEVNVNDQTVPAEGPQKPTLYFLKGAHGDQGGAASEGAPASAPAPPAPAAASEEEGAATGDPAPGYRRRRQNVREDLSALNNKYEAPRRRTVYIFRKAVS